MFKLESSYTPKGDQPAAIKELVSGLNEGSLAQTLLGVTGSGKTFTIANVIEQTQRPTLVLTHNKTLVAQLYGEFKQFFPDNAVEYFVSYYDYYQPESYIPSSDTYIEKDLSINEEIDKLRLSTTSSLLSGRRDVIVVASVSCIYGMGNPKDFKTGVITINKGQTISRNTLLFDLVNALYSRTVADFSRATFRVNGEVVDINVPYADYGYRLLFFDDEIEGIQKIDPKDNAVLEDLEQAVIFPASFYITPKEQVQSMIHQIQDDLVDQVNYFQDVKLHLEAARIKERVEFDLEMIRELGYCSGIENYSRYIDKRQPGERPFCLLDYFPEDFLLVVDESHVTLPQVGGMHAGDRARKINLVEHGFRLPAAMDNRPLNYEEFNQLIGQRIYVSATPGDEEIERSEGVVVEQIVRPTGLLDPPIEIRPSKNQIDDLLFEINARTAINERILVTTLTKRMAEELAKFLAKANVRCRYIHSGIDTLDRVEIIRDLRIGKFDVLVGVNLLREGLDLPEVSLVAIIDADKEGFLRDRRSMIQTAGRAARNVHGKVIFYADKVTKSMQATLDETQRRRSIQIEYNQKNNITPTSVKKSKDEILKSTSVLEIRKSKTDYALQEDLVETTSRASLNREQWKKEIENRRKAMRKSAKDMDFLEAARLRDEVFEWEKAFEEKYGKS